MRFDLRSGSTKCITEDLKRESMTVGRYSVINPITDQDQPLPQSHHITARVTSPRGNSYHYGDTVDSGSFAFTAPETGDYMVCFWAPSHDPPLIVTIEFEWNAGIDARNWSNVARKGHIDLMEIELKRLYETVRYIHEEMFYLREREEEMQQLNRATNSKMATFSFLSIMVCLGVVALQMWHLKAFFERKKLL
ncbi:hypothetical protein Dimus_036342 [Dionaea muscipula]